MNYDMLFGFGLGLLVYWFFRQINISCKKEVDAEDEYINSLNDKQFRDYHTFLRERGR